MAREDKHKQRNLSTDSIKSQQEQIHINDKDLLNKLPDKNVEIGGVKGLEPTRYGDWQHKGRVSDF